VPILPLQKGKICPSREAKIASLERQNLPPEKNRIKEQAKKKTLPVGIGEADRREDGAERTNSIARRGGWREDGRGCSLPLRRWPSLPSKVNRVFGA
jgi:hypothetical protein